MKQLKDLLRRFWTKVHCNKFEGISLLLSFLRRLWIDIKYKIRGIKNIFIWTPILIEDRQWDHTFVLMILKKKFELMEKYFLKYGHHVGSNKDAKNIRFAINLLDKLIKDDYMENAFIPHKKKYGEGKMIFKNIPNSKSSELLIEYDVKTNTLKEKEQERQLFLKCSKQEDYLRKQDLEILFKHLHKHLFSWWD
jgi:hypothetical protein